MAVINFFQDSISELTEKKEVKSGVKLRDCVQDYIDSINNKQIVEVYDPETDTTEFVELVSDSYNCVIYADGKETDLDFICKKDSVVEVLFFPKDAWTGIEKAGAITTGVGVGIMTAVGIAAIVAATVATGGIFAGSAIMLSAAGAIWLGVGAATTAAGGLMWASGRLARSSNDNINGESVSQGKTESLLSINGGSNKSLIGHPYPLVFGKHLINPSIVGAPYHVTLSRAANDIISNDVISEVNTGNPIIDNFIKLFLEIASANVKKFKTDHDDLGQYWQAIYCIGYAPLKLTRFKIGETYLAYNEFNEKNGTKNTLLHGLLTGNDICNKWKNNDVEIEILQAGDLLENQKSNKDRWGSIYPTTVIEEPIEGCPILYVYDKSLADSDPEGSSKETASYGGKSLKLGLRTNSVRFSKSCPYRIEVELNMPNGFFGTRTFTTSDSSITKYMQPRLYIAVQWRYIDNNNSSPDAESPNGWNNFDYELLYDSNGNQIQKAPVEYTSKRRNLEITENFGLTKGTLAQQNPNWIGSKVFALNAGEGDSEWVTTSASEIGTLVTQGKLQYQLVYYDEYKVSVLRKDVKTAKSAKSNIKIFDYRYLGTDSKGNPSYGYKVRETVKFCGYKSLNEDIKIEQKTTAGYLNRHYWKQVGKDTWTEVNDYVYHDNIPYEEVVEIKHYVTIDDSAFRAKDQYNLNERRYVFCKTFTDKECSAMINTEKHSTTHLDNIEVRVVRITPCYLNEPSSSNTNSKLYSAMEYQDLLNWSYLRTWTFDKRKFGEAWDKTGSIPKVTDYLERPIPEDDLNRFCYVALRLKQDVSQTGGSTLKKLNCIAEALLPKFDIDRKKWNPVLNTKGEYEDFTVEEEFKYYYTDWGEEGDAKKTIVTLPLPMYEDENNTIIDNRNIILGFLEMKKAPITFDTNQDYYFYNELEDRYIRTYVSSDNYDNTNLFIIENYLNTGYLQYKQGCSIKEKANLFTKKKYGTTYLNDLRNKVIGGARNKSLPTRNTYPASCSNLQSITPYNYYMTDEIAHNYLTKNSASASIYSLIGPHLKDDAKDLSQINMTKFADMFEFCNDITDGSKENYTKPMTTSSLPSGFYNTFSNAFNSRKNTEEAKRILAVLKKAPVNAVWKGCYDCYLENLIFEVMAATSTEVLKIEYLNTAKVFLENNGYFAESDEKLHIQYNCNGIVSSEVKLEDLFYKTLVTGRSYYRRSDNNKYEPVIGRSNPYPVTVLNQRNVVSKSNTRSYEENPSGFLVSMIDENDNYGVNTIYAMDDGEDYKSPTKRVENFSIDFVTNPYQMKSLARFNLACKLYQKEVYTRTITSLGYSLGVGDTILIQDDSLLIGTDKGGRIKEIIEDDDYVYGFVTDDLFNYTGEIEDDDNNEDIPELDKRCKQGATIVQASKYNSSRCVTVRFANPSQSVIVDGVTYQMTRGLTNLCLFADKVIKATELSEGMELDGEIYTYNPHIDDLVAFGNINTITSKAVVMSVKPKENDQFEITAVPYNEQLYNFGEKFPQFRSNMTTPSRADSDFIYESYQTTSDVAEKLAQATQATMNQVESGDEEGVPDEVSSLNVIINNSRYIQFIPEMTKINGTNNNINTYKYQINRGYENKYTVATSFVSGKIYYTFNDGNYQKANPQPTIYYVPATSSYQEDITYFVKDDGDYVIAEPQPSPVYESQEVFDSSLVYYLYNEEEDAYEIASSQPTADTWEEEKYYIYKFDPSEYYTQIDTFSSKTFYIKDEITNWVDINVSNNIYNFDRSVDGYPELDDWIDENGVIHNGLKKWNFRVKAINQYGLISEKWTYAREV